MVPTSRISGFYLSRVTLGQSTPEQENLMRQLRDYQESAVNKIRTEWSRGIVRTVIVHSTGLGKTDIIAKLATDEAAAGGRVLLLAHRSEPLDQMTQRCLTYAPHIPVGRVQADLNETSCAITAASVQTVSHDKRLNQLLHPTMVIIDECHHSMATSFIKILNWAGSFKTTRTLGVTATLVRGDGRGFGELFETVADSKGIDWAVRHRWLVPPRGKAVLLRNLDLQTMTVRHGDYADSELGPVIDAGSEAIVKAWQNNAGDRITVAFTPTIASAQALCTGFTAQGVPAEVVIGSTARDDRKAIYARLAAGQTRVLVSVMVTTEAWDCPPVSCVLMARPTALPGLYQQMMGRGLRLADGKTDCLVLDVVGVSRGQKLITLVNMVPSALYDDSEIRPRKRRSAVVRPRIVQRVRDWLFSRGF
jgi:superfamily II DNA or RNA helicase